MYYSKITGGYYTKDVHGDNIPYDAVLITDEDHAVLLAGQSSGRKIIADGNGRPMLTTAPGPDYKWTGSSWVLDLDHQKKRIVGLMQHYMDSKAVAYGYDHILSAISYADSGVEKWRKEGSAFKSWRESVWSFGLNLLAAVEAGTNAINTDADLIAALPVFPLE